MPILACRRRSNNAPDGPGKWYPGQVVNCYPDDHEFGFDETPDAGGFYHITVTDKTLEEVEAYIQGWNHNPTTQQISANGDDRLIEVTSDMVSVSGKNAFTQAGVEALMADINGTYESHTNNSFRFSITATVEEKDGIIEAINAAVRDMQYARRRYQITPEGQAILNANGGIMSGTASQVVQYLRDGLLD